MFLIELLEQLCDFKYTAKYNEDDQSVTCNITDKRTPLTININNFWIALNCSILDELFPLQSDQDTCHILPYIGYSKPGSSSELTTEISISYS